MLPSAPSAPPATLRCEGWQCEVLAETTSTNTHVSQMGPWVAVRAVTQTAGRGRTPDRKWISDVGGLWLSAVVPCPGARAKWSILPLAAGWAILRAMRELGVKDTRLRWPNDIMVGSRKLAGLLVERFSNTTAVIGVGINVFNRPEHHHHELKGSTVRLADLVPSGLTVDDVACAVLRALRAAHATLLKDGFRTIADELNQQWDRPVRVRITLTGRVDTVDGLFCGVDQQGRLRLQTPREGSCVYDASQVALLREIE